MIRLTAEAYLPAHDESDAASSAAGRALDRHVFLRCDRSPECHARARPPDDASPDSEVSRGCLAQDGLVQFRLGDQLHQTSILPRFQTLFLIAPDAPVLFPPAIVRVVRHTDLTICLGHIPTLRQQNLHFTKLLNGLFGPESLTWLSLPPALESNSEFTILELVAVMGAGQTEVSPVINTGTHYH